MINMKNQLNKMKWGPFLTKTKKDSSIRKGNITTKTKKKRQFDTKRKYN